MEYSARECWVSVVSRHVTSCRVMTWRVMMCHDVSCRVASCCVVSCSVKVYSFYYRFLVGFPNLSHVMSRRVASWRVVMCRIMSCRVASCRVALICIPYQLMNTPGELPIFGCHVPRQNDFFNTYHSYFQKNTINLIIVFINPRYSYVTVLVSST